jgi:hypothetical protein
VDPPIPEWVSERGGTLRRAPGGDSVTAITDHNRPDTNPPGPTRRLRRAERQNRHVPRLKIHHYKDSQSQYSVFAVIVFIDFMDIS